jgi:holliday junction DNA helicase RuvA
VIATLTGKVQAKTSTSIVVDVNGVGFLVSTPKFLASQAEVGEQISLFTTLVVREDSFQLFGFEGVEQQGLFDLLRSVSGVGPKTALTILSTLNPAEISLAVTNDDSKPFESVSGVGVKTAKLINVTLAGKLKSAGAAGSSIEADLLSALQSLGWNERTALPVVQDVVKVAGNQELAALIRLCLAQLSK